MNTRLLISYFMAICLLSVNPLKVNANDIPATIPVITAATTASTNAPAIIPQAPKLNAKGYVLMDANTGAVIAEKAMNQRMAPASLTKIMTLYVTFQALANHQIKLDDKVRISKKAWHMGGSRMFLDVGSEVTVESLIEGVIVASGNDACVALAEYIGGSESTFATLMNQAAAQLGMKATSYVDSTGLPSTNHYSTPYDMAILARAIINDFPQYYHYFGQKWLNYNSIKQPNRNRLLWRDNTVDGLKTGHTNDAGFCLIASAKRDNMRLISVMMGSADDSERSSDSQALLNYGFRFYKTYKIFDAKQTINTARVWLGKQKYLAFGIAEPLYLTLATGENKRLNASIHMDRKLTAPIIAGQSYGNVSVKLGNNEVANVPLIALQDDPKAGFTSRLIDRITMFFKG